MEYQTATYPRYGRHHVGDTCTACRKSFKAGDEVARIGDRLLHVRRMPAEAVR